MNAIRILTIFATILLAQFAALAAVPSWLNYQGRIAVNGTGFNGSGSFKFALVNASGSTTYWSNDNSSAAGSQPAAAVAIPVSGGIYSVQLGDTALANMAAVPTTVFDNTEVWLRVWFNDGVNGFEQIVPDQRLASVPYALIASKVEQVQTSDIVGPPLKPVVAWGRNTDGQTSVPVIANVTAVAAGTNQSLALLSDGSVVKWGGGPSLPLGLANVTHIAAGTAHNLARKADGTVVAWGDNTNGKATVPGGITNAVAVAAGESHSVALRADGTLTTWGGNSFNQLVIPGGLANVTAIAAGYDHTVALKGDGTVVAWGRNDTQQCDVPAGLTGVVAIGAGAYHSLAVKGDGTVVAWGFDIGGQSTVPAGLGGVIAVAGGYAFSVALKSDGSVAVWGDNGSFQHVIPPTATDVTAIAAGASHVLALRAAFIPAQVARLDQESVFTERVGIKRTPTINTLEVEGTASKSTAGSWLANSDRRIKHDVQPITGALEKLDRVRLVDFRYTDDYRATHPGVGGERYLNVIAQEFAEVFPGHVKSSGEKLRDGSEILQVDTYPLTIYSAAAVQELHRENKALKQSLAEQDARLRRIEAAFGK
jgi:Chaperone of endosialidase/Regulator of chromosome condensation (RCC1) repeat